MIYPCFYGNLAVARQQHACKVTLTWEWPSTGARVAVPFMIWVRTFSRSLCWLCAQVCPDLQSSQKDPHGFGTRFRTVAQARDYRREHMMPPCDKPDYVEPNDSAHELWTYPWRRRDGQSNDNLHFVSGTTGGSGDVLMFMLYVQRSGTVLHFFPRGFYSITATQFMFGDGGLQRSHMFIIHCVFYCFHSWFILFPGAF